jgi:hypothetical protein
MRSASHGPAHCFHARDLLAGTARTTVLFLAVATHAAASDYDDHAYSAALTDTATERGPPMPSTFTMCGIW